MGIDVYDYTLLHKKGLLKLPERKSSNGITFNKDGDIDFTKMQGIIPSQDIQQDVISAVKSESNAQSAPSENAFSFLDSFAQASSSSTSSVTSYPSAPVNDLSLSSSSSMGNSDMTHVKQRLDAIDYSLNRLLDRLEGIEQKLSRNP